ncbi:MAG: adenosine deaminase family protein, partial [Candidatus Omnitrophota bacterium]
MSIPRELILKLPKTDLHLHLSGSIRLGTLIELARDSGVKLPSYTESGLRETVFTGQFECLEEYLECFS